LDTGLLPNAEVTICRLRAGASEVERRLLARDGQPGPPAGGRVALITGPAGVGKSTIGFRLYQRCLQAGLTAGYVDLGQIGLVRPADAGDPGHQRLRARNLAAIWRNYRAAGATHLVATGAIGSQADLGPYAREMQGPTSRSSACGPEATSSGAGSCRAARAGAGPSPETACSTGLTAVACPSTRRAGPLVSRPA
jgi:hypothetical protein